MGEIFNVLKDVTPQFMSMKNVVGVGRGYKTVGGNRTASECIVVMVEKKLPKLRVRNKDLMPKEVRGVPIDVIEVGEFRFLNERQCRMRPAQPGVSLGHYQITAGTFGAIVYDEKTEEQFILSNNHVLANGTSGRDGKAQLGDAILQPGVADGGVWEKDRIGYLERFIPLEMSGRVHSCFLTQIIESAINRWLALIRSPIKIEIISRSTPNVPNIVDAALARPVGSDSINLEILGLGKIEGVIEPELGLHVKKSGRSTGVTKGQIQVIDATVNIVYSRDVTAMFQDQIITDNMGAGGDSGSVLLDENMNAVGLLFAGSDKFTIYNRITNALKLLEVSFIKND